MNEIEAMQVERILRAAHRVAKRAVMDARTADAPASGLWAASGGTGRENTSLVAKFTVKRKNGTKQSGLTIPQVQKMVGIYGRLGQQLSMLKKGRALKTPNGDFITRDARVTDIGAGRGKVTTEIGQGLSEVQAIAFLRRYAGQQTGGAVDAIKKVTELKRRNINKEGVSMVFGVPDYSGFKVHCFESVNKGGYYRYTIKVWKPQK